MRIRLEKKNRITIDFVQMEIDEHLLKIQSGKLGESGVSDSIKHCGTNEKAINELNKLKQEFIQKKYIEIKTQKRPSDFNGVYDKAKWHFDGEFPKELNNFQGYVHTGFYLTWIIENGLFDTNGDDYLNSEISKVKKKELTGAEFFERNLDGVLMDDDLTELGNEFTYNYYEKGNFLDDYSKTLGTDLPTLYHIQDNWENYEKFKPLLDKRFKRWEKSKKPKWWKLN
ncbi:MAG: hypothetical protein JJ892_04470 [Balneola sp.]|nr:hypothetical protein [Balneola sp.]MBO6651297.1 hypothetical protein [Balneola sp.]MBO6710827.1 hypothetical protein [Balneola sp.]MBO6799514.1 hypothetical protein [Balneola sp.]MBO6870246.1 hypothetical protein [Balneola sp.]